MNAVLHVVLVSALNENVRIVHKLSSYWFYVNVVFHFLIFHLLPTYFFLLFDFLFLF